MLINRLGSIVVKRFWKIVVFLVYGEVKSFLVVRNALSNKLNKDSSISLDKKWAEEINQSSKCLNYRIFKSNCKFEHHLTTSTYNNRRLCAIFRCRSHNLPVEKAYLESILELKNVYTYTVHKSINININLNSDDESGNGSDQSFDTGSVKGEDQHPKQNSNADLDIERVIEQLEQTRAELQNANNEKEYLRYKIKRK